MQQLSENSPTPPSLPKKNTNKKHHPQHCRNHVPTFKAKANKSLSMVFFCLGSGRWWGEVIERSSSTTLESVEGSRGCEDWNKNYDFVLESTFPNKKDGMISEMRIQGGIIVNRYWHGISDNMCIYKQYFGMIYYIWYVYLYHCVWCVRMLVFCWALSSRFWFGISFWLNQPADL